MATARFYWLMSLVVVVSGACNAPTKPDDEVGDVGEVGQALEVTSVDLSQYTLAGRYNLPEPTRTTPPNSVSLLAQEASSVTYNWDTNTLFVVGDSGTAVTQVSKTGALIDTMTLAPGSSPQGTEFYDTEGIAYVGGGQFVFTEERYRQVVRFSYVAGATLNRVDVQTVKLGTTIGNVEPRLLLLLLLFRNFIRTLFERNKSLDHHTVISKTKQPRIQTYIRKSKQQKTTKQKTINKQSKETKSK